MLKSKERLIDEIVTDYETEGSSIVQSIVRVHGEERRQLVESHHRRCRSYIQICQEARRDVSAVSATLSAFNFGKPAKSNASKTLDRLSRLQTELSGK